MKPNPDDHPHPTAAGLLENPEATRDDESTAPTICVHCGHSNDLELSRCGGCGAPLDPFASTAPWEFGTATSTFYHTPTDPRIKPVIFWGVWLYFGPSAIGAIWVLINGARDLAQRDPALGFPGDEIAIALITTVYGAISIWAVWSVSARYIRKTSTDHA